MEQFGQNRSMLSTRHAVHRKTNRQTMSFPFPSTTSSAAHRDMTKLITKTQTAYTTNTLTGSITYFPDTPQTRVINQRPKPPVAVLRLWTKTIQLFRNHCTALRNTRSESALYHYTKYSPIQNSDIPCVDSTLRYMPTLRKLLLYASNTIWQNPSIAHPH